VRFSAKNINSRTSVRPSVRRAKNSSVSPEALTENYTPDFGHVFGTFYASSVKSSETDTTLYFFSNSDLNQ